ncbi:hypothetical protein [Streptomyces sp. NPDC005322]|uniref:hypothetical protein n=1 Tax=Streptomyces sp. NPDC005322 TaxID=3157032 RepID=UPI00339F0677
MIEGRRMSFRGMKKDDARNLAAALDVSGGALATQGDLIRGIVAKWGGEAGKLARFPGQSTWHKEHAKDVRRRIGILDGDPDRVLMMASYVRVVKTWEEAKERGRELAEDIKKRAEDAKETAEYFNDSQEKKDALAIAKSLSITKGVAAYRRFSKAWRAAQAVQSFLDLRKKVPGSLKAVTTLFDELREAKAGFVKPWKVMELGSKIKGLGFLAKAPGQGIFDKVMLPLSFVTGLKEFIMPSHAGARGIADRGMGLLQAGGAGVVMAGWASGAIAASAIPVIGWTAMGIAGAYFLGSWAWDKWGDDIKGGAKKAANWVKNKVGQKLDEAANAVKKVVHVPGPVKKLKFW